MRGEARALDDRSCRVEWECGVRDTGISMAKLSMELDNFACRAAKRKVACGC